MSMRFFLFFLLNFHVLVANKQNYKTKMFAISTETFYFVASKDFPFWLVARTKPRPDRNRTQVANDLVDIKTSKNPLLYLMVQNYNQMFTNGLWKKPQKHFHSCTIHCFIFWVRWCWASHLQPWQHYRGIRTGRSLSPPQPPTWQMCALMWSSRSPSTSMLDWWCFSCQYIYNEWLSDLLQQGSVVVQRLALSPHGNKVSGWNFHDPSTLFSSYLCGFPTEALISSRSPNTCMGG